MRRHREVLDLVSSSDDEGSRRHSLGRRRRRDGSSYSRKLKTGATNIPASLVISIDSDGDVNQKPKARPSGRRQQSAWPSHQRSTSHGPFGAASVTTIDDVEDGRKPAAKECSMPSRKSQQNVAIDLSTTQSSPISERWLSVAAAARRPTPQHLVGEFLEVKQKGKTLLERVLEVFPDVDLSYAEKRLRECRDNLEMVLSALADGPYPKSKHLKRTHSGAPVPNSVLVKRAKAQPKYDYSSASSFEPSPKYITEAVLVLLEEFPFCSIRGMEKILLKHKNHYTIARNYFVEILKEGGSKSAKNFDDKDLQHVFSFKAVYASKKLSVEQKRRLGGEHCVKRITRRPKVAISDPILKDEVEFSKSQHDEWLHAMEQKFKRVQARKRIESAGNGVECGCCFVTVDIEEMVACRNEGHLFCADCIESYAETAVFSNGSLGTIKATGKQSCELLCFDASGCQSGFHEEHLQKALPARTLEKYSELQFRASIEAAGLEDQMCSCSKCGFRANLPPNLIIFQCPMEDCRHEMCRKCGKPPHIPLRCDEVVQKKREDEGRLRVEEALAEAKIRKCPKCSTPFVKSDGCNKMTCRCGTKMCYICRKELKGDNPYAHFCQTPLCKHQNCKQCVLYSNAEEDDRRAMREAGLTAAEAYRKDIRTQEGVEPDVNIDVDKIMGQDPSNIRANRVTVPGLLAARARPNRA